MDNFITSIKRGFFLKFRFFLFFFVFFINMSLFSTDETEIPVWD